MSDRAELAVAVVDTILRSSKGSACLTPSGEREVAIACEAAKDTLRVAFNDVVHEAQGASLLTTKSADGTPISVMERSMHHLPSGTRFASSGRKSVEFLCKNQFVRYLKPTGGHKTAVLLTEANALTYGKTMAAIREACLKDWVSLRQSGHYGPATEHYVFDRLGLTALERSFRQWHKSLAGQFEHLVQDPISTRTLGWL